MKKVMKQSTVVRILSYISVILLLITALSVGFTAWLNQKNNQSRINQYDLVQACQSFWDGSQYLTTQIRRYASTGDEKYYNNYEQEINQTKRRENALAFMQQIGLSQEEQSYMDTIHELSANELEPIESEAIEYIQMGRLFRASNLLYGSTYMDDAQQIENGYNAFKEAIVSRTDHEIARRQIVITCMTIFCFLCMIGVFCMVVRMIWFVNRKLIAPIVQIQQNMVSISEGNLSEPLAIAADTSEIGTLAGAMHSTKDFLKDIIGDIGHALQRMADGQFNFTIETEYIGEFNDIKTALQTILHSMNATLAQIDTAADQVNNGSEQVSNGAQALSQGATQQASAVEELAATINEVSNQVHQTAENSRQANEGNERVANELQTCHARMDDLIAAMGDISTASSEIERIIKTIDDIAFQTNILALNAAVEAARAGAAGKGFAVVADEVRNLATKSAEAAKNTTNLIATAIQAVQTGSSIADETADSLNTVIAISHEVEENVEKIAHASKEQATATEQVTQGIDQISAVVQTNSATAEQSAAASEELSGQAQMLRNLISHFVISTDNRAAFPQPVDSSASTPYAASGNDSELSLDTVSSKY